MNSRAQRFSIHGADDVAVQGNAFDGMGVTSMNEIWDEPAGAVPERFTIRGNSFTGFWGPTSTTHSEALYVGYSADGLIEGNAFTDNGTTAHIFFTWFGTTADSGSSWPRRICVRGNTFGPTHGAYFDVDMRVEIPLSSLIAIAPGQGATVANSAFIRACA